jgi:hypothetical protein
MKNTVAGFSKNPLMVGTTIVEHVKHVTQAHEAMINYFTNHSKFMHAVQDHVMNADDCVLFDKGGREVHRLGCIRVKDVVAPYAMPGECQMLHIQCVVALSPLETDYPEYDLGNDIEKPLSVYAPSDLELNFTIKKFELWLNTMAEKRAKEANGKDLEKLKELIQKHPKVAKEALALVRTRQRKKKRYA